MLEWVDTQKIGLIASIILPFFNIPLMVRMIQRRSAEDISLAWLFGVYICLIAIMPSAWQSSDFIFKIFSMMNLILFSGVVLVTLWFRVFRRKSPPLS